MPKTAINQPLNEYSLKSEVDAASVLDSALLAVLQKTGYPEPRQQSAGLKSLMRVIVSQQLSVKAAATIWQRFVDLAGNELSVEWLLQQTDQALRGVGLSRQKISYLRSLSCHVRNGQLNVDVLGGLPVDEAIAQLTQVKGYGQWSAEIYLMFALGKTDIYPAGDLALQVAIQTLEAWDKRPTEKQTRDYAQRWAPHRTAVALLMWKYYGTTTLSNS